MTTTLNGIQEATKDSLRALSKQVPLSSAPGEVVHNYYTDSEFFTHDAAAGVTKNKYGQRVIRAPEEFIIALSASLESEVGERSASEIMYKCGQGWGQQDMQAFTKRAQHEFQCEFQHLGMGMMLESWWWPFTIQGWGAWKYDFTHGREGLIFVDLFESAVAKSLGDVGSVVCHYYAGLFSSSFTVLADRDLSCIEVQCYASGEDHCKFLISSSERVKAAEFWREEGAKASDILENLKA